MALEKVTHIEGLETFQDVSLKDDSDPGAMVVRFEVVAEEMPFKTAEQGKVVRENFVHIYKEWEVGHTSFRRRIRDTVKFDEKEGKWKVTMLADERNSDILKHPAEWNAFALGTANIEVGTPLSVLFKSDPARVLMYKDKHITTVERLAGVNQTDASLMGLGVFDDVQRAKEYVSKLRENGSVGLLSQIEDQEHKISVLERTIAELKAQLDNPVQEEEAPKKRGRPRKVPSEINEGAFTP